MQGTQLKTNRPPWKRLLREAAAVWGGGWLRLWPRLWIILTACVVGAILVLTASATDVSLQQMARIDNIPAAKPVARFLSRYGDVNVAGPVAILIWLLGVVASNVRWRKIGLACLMAGLLSGLIVNIFRVNMGRPRPYAAQPFTEVADGFYGPHRNTKYQSYPSGHATASASTAASLAGAVPVLTIPATIFAVSVSWSRMQLNMHHPIDVTVGAIIGVTCGLCFASTVPGAGIRLKRRRRATIR
jgi:undecaprenyl-diphosphatase